MWEGRQRFEMVRRKYNLGWNNAQGGIAAPFTGESCAPQRPAGNFEIKPGHSPQQQHLRDKRSTKQRRAFIPKENSGRVVQRRLCQGLCPIF